MGLSAMMHLMDDEHEGRLRLARQLREARRAQYGNVEQAIRAAEVNRATWLKAEAGERVRDNSLRAIEAAIDRWRSGDAWRIMEGRDPLGPEPSPEADRHSALRRQIMDDLSLTEPARRLLLAVLDSAPVADTPPRQSDTG